VKRKAAKPAAEATKPAAGPAPASAAAPAAEAPKQGTVGTR
jgi:hypothetical protein